MSDTRRTFLQSAALAAGLAGRTSPDTAFAQQAQQNSPGQDRSPGHAQPALSASSNQASEVQVPKVKFFDVEISRLVLGVNPFYGYAHYNTTLGTIMREYYTPERICQVMHHCTRFGINAFNYVNLGRAQQDLERFQGEGGKMHLITQAIGDPAKIYSSVKPLAMYMRGTEVDRAHQRGDMGPVKEWCKKARDTGARIGIGTHRPEVIQLAEDDGWDLDFYAGCVYNVTRTAEDWRKILGGELPEMPGEVYIQSDPSRMYKVLRHTRKPCFAYKILAAGRVGDDDLEQAFRTAFESIKPGDGIFVGMFPRTKDQVRENAERVHRLLTA
jgi:hypothetical protein